MTEPMPDQTPDTDRPTYGELLDNWSAEREKANDYLIRLGRAEERLTEVERERDTAAAQLEAANRAVEHLSSRAGDRQDAQADTGTDARFVRALSLIHHLMRSRRMWQSRVAEFEFMYSLENTERIAAEQDRDTASDWAAWFAAERDHWVERLAMGFQPWGRRVSELEADVLDARNWARHGYEIGQRSCTWSDHGVTPAWLTEGHTPESLEPTEDQRRLFGLDEENAKLRARIAELEEQARTQALGVQLSYALDLWMAMGCPLSEFDGYVERNRIADTWANLLGVVRGLFRPKCGKPTDGGPCVLTAHQIGPCHSRKDMGASEPVPHAEPLPESAPRNPDAYIAVKRNRYAEAAPAEWHWDAAVIPAGEHHAWDRAEHERRGYELLPIVATETGTRPATVQSDPVGYVVVTRNSEGGVHRSATVWDSLEQANTAEGIASGYADGTGCTAAVYALQEVQQ